MSNQDPKEELDKIELKETDGAYTSLQDKKIDNLRLKGFKIVGENVHVCLEKEGIHCMIGEFGRVAWY